MEDLLKRQDDLQKEAKVILQEIDLLNILSTYGKPEIVGSLATGLMTWKDIDIEVIGEINEEKYWKVVRKLFNTPQYKKLFVANFINSINPNTPKGLYISIEDYGKTEERWKIDMWFLPPRKPDEKNYNEWIRNKITDENKSIILSIKSGIVGNPKYGKEIFSLDIYKAVIENGVKNLDDFKKYLQAMGRQLD